MQLQIYHKNSHNEGNPEMRMIQKNNGPENTPEMGTR